MIFLLFAVPLTLNKVVTFVEERFLRHLPKKGVVGLLISVTIIVEIVLSMMLSRRLGWSFTEGHFTVGFLLFILVWFMQFNEWMGNKYANVDNKVYGSGKDVYAVQVFRFSLNPFSIATLVYFLGGVASSIVLYAI
ncbi:hypothetical protein LCM20_04165 [Halobacillus litoralis]|uniref:hypothetical protein n=1 Tax=Halobacillus litoralis TaxID=45668 RepID=UPI001CD7F219|nr:hypothetical protein [Halobacillus litoralis]MCA0969789.1 hypothetical protein [Halobacillus litoralis]